MHRLIRIVIWLVALYLGADFSDPGLPGAFNFSANDSVEVVRVEKPNSPVNPLRAANPEPSVTFVRLADDTRVSTSSVVAASAITVASHSPTARMRPRIRHLASEDCPAASPAV